MTDPADMTPEQLRVEIAEWAGWTDEFPSYDGGILLPYKFYNKLTGEKAMDRPDYCNDLNDMDVALRTLKQYQRYEWTRNMRAVINEQATAEQLNPDTKHIEDFYFYNASALQRAIAFVRVIRG